MNQRVYKSQLVRRVNAIADPLRTALHGANEPPAHIDAGQIGIALRRLDALADDVDKGLFGPDQHFEAKGKDKAAPQGEPAFADLADMQAWAADIMQREPDFIIGDNYLRRWWVIPRNHVCNIYLHEILKSDDDRALHDHPWVNSSWVLDGSYIEHLPDGTAIERVAGDFVTREATDLHRLEIPEGGRALSLFATGPKVREWGFACPKGWVYWRDFVGEDVGQIGRGCGE